MAIILNILVIVLPLAFAIYILRGLDVAAKHRKAGFRFFVVDLFSLLFLIQLPLAIVERVSSGSGERIVEKCIFSAVMIVIWWGTINTTSRAGIQTTKWRALISLIVIPSTYIGSFAITILALSIRNTPVNSPMLPAATGWLAFAISCLIASGFITCAALRATGENPIPVAGADSESPESL